MLSKKQRDCILDLAVKDAELHQSEFPGEAIQGDWDSISFSESIKSLDLPEDKQNEAWDCYREHLHLTVNLWINTAKYGTASEVAKAVGVARTTLITAAKRNEIAHCYTIGQTLLIDVAAAKRWSKQTRKTGPKPKD